MENGDDDRRDKGNSRSPAGMTTRKTKTNATAIARGKNAVASGIDRGVFGG
jgi:hypothetical protein